MSINMNRMECRHWRAAYDVNGISTVHRATCMGRRLESVIVGLITASSTNSLTIYVRKKTVGFNIVFCDNTTDYKIDKNESLSLITFVPNNSIVTTPVELVVPGRRCAVKIYRFCDFIFILPSHSSSFTQIARTLLHY